VTGRTYTILLGGIAESESVYCDTCYRSMVCPSVCACACVSSFTLVHSAKAVGRNEMPFGRDTRVVQRALYLTRAPVPHGKWDLGVGSPVRSDALALVYILLNCWNQRRSLRCSQNMQQNKKKNLFMQQLHTFSGED